MTFLQKTKRFFEPIKQDKWTYIKSGIEGFCDGLYLISILFFFEKIGQSIHFENEQLFWTYVTAYGVISIIYFVFKTFVIHWGWVNIYVSIDSFSANTYLTRFIEGEPNTVEKIGTGRFLQIYKSGTRLWMETIHGFLSSDLALLVSSVYGIIRVSQFNILYGASIITILCLVLVITYYTDKKFTIPYRKKRVEAETEYGRILARIFMSKMEYLQNNEFKKELGRIAGMLEYIRVQNYGIDNSVGGMYIGIRVVSVLLRLAVYIFVGNAIFANQASFWIFSTYVLIVMMLETTLRTVYDSFRKVTRDGQHIEKLWSTFDSLTPIRGYDSGEIFKPTNKDIIIDSITYGYNESKVFSDFSLTLARGKKTALVGASGGGKTTLMKLIAGYLHPESGSISVLGNNLGETALKTYYPHIGYLTQEPGVFDATIRENLVSAISQVPVMSTESSVSVTTTRHPARKDKQARFLDSAIAPLEMTETIQKQMIRNDENIDELLERALRLAQCDFVFEMEKGLDTEIGERGVRLSGGQKQRLAIAKIFLKDPEIILLDEPTSALDSFSEEKITEALNILFEGRTVIIVAHRLQTVKRADDIIVIEGGEVVERGNHDELVEKGGIYNKMLELQSGF